MERLKRLFKQVYDVCIFNYLTGIHYGGFVAGISYYGWASRIGSISKLTPSTAFTGPLLVK